MPHIFPLKSWEPWDESRVDKYGNLWVKFGLPESPAILAHEINHFRLGYYGKGLSKEPLACLRAEVEVWRESLKHLGPEWNEFAVKCLATYRVNVASTYGDYSFEDLEAAEIFDEFKRQIELKKP